MNGRWTDVASSDGGSFQAYVGLPPTGMGPGIVLIQEIFGVNEHIRGVADQYAMDGFVVLAPDVFWREAPRVELGYDDAAMARGRALKGNLNFDSAIQDLVDSTAALRKLPQVVGKVASLGYCMGGLLSYLLAASGRVDAGICYYGAGIEARLDREARMTCPMLFHFAEQDQLIPVSAVKTVSRTFASHADAWVQTYPGVGHGFNCWARAAYNQPAAALARGRTLEFLSIYL